MARHGEGPIMNDAHPDALLRQFRGGQLTRRSTVRLLTGAGLAAGLTALDRNLTRAQDPLGKRNPLLQFWHDSRTDNILTATPAGWAAARRAGYDLVRVEGWVRPTAPQGVGSENFLPLRATGNRQLASACHRMEGRAKRRGLASFVDPPVTAWQISSPYCRSLLGSCGTPDARIT